MSQRRDKDVPRPVVENELRELVQTLVDKYPFLRPDAETEKAVPSIRREEGAADQALKKLRERLTA